MGSNRTRQYVLEHHPRVYAWAESLDDMSGYLVSDEDWLKVDAIPQTLKDLLGEVGRVYAPYLLANSRAVSEGAKQLQMTLEGRPWEQNPFPYQRKCLQWLQDAYFTLEASDRQRVDTVLFGTGCEALFENAD